MKTVQLIQRLKFGQMTTHTHTNN